jgi:histidinol-phosphate aminotransferase
MAVSRRGFFGIVGAGERASDLGALIAARGFEAEQAELQQGQGQGRGGGQGRMGGAGRGGGRGNRPQLPDGVEPIRISSNENPLGPGQAVLNAITGKFPEAGRYPFNSTPNDGKLVETIATLNKAKPENVVLGAGSQEILKGAIRAFTSPFRPLVTAAPTFENCTGQARRMGHPVIEVKVDSALRLNLEEMLASVRGAGLVFLNNPNNPTATAHSAKAVQNFVERVRRISPDTVILIDEAYHEYVTDPNYQTAIPLALSTPNVFVARTFSKAYGMAGMRIGYAVGEADTMKPLARVKMPYNISVFGIAAAITALNDAAHLAQERTRNTQVRDFTVKALADLGCKSSDSQCNFIFTDVGRPAREFRDACAKLGVNVGRDFPPYEHSHVRISIGTMAEMQRATQVFREVLGPATPANGNGRSGRTFDAARR